MTVKTINILKFPILIAFLLQLTFAGTTGKMAGQVKAKNSGDPLIGVNVLIEGTNLGSCH